MVYQSRGWHKNGWELGVAPFRKHPFWNRKARLFLEQEALNRSLYIPLCFKNQGESRKTMPSEICMILGWTPRIIDRNPVVLWMVRSKRFSFGRSFCFGVQNSMEVSWGIHLKSSMKGFSIRGAARGYNTSFFYCWKSSYLPITFGPLRVSISAGYPKMDGL